jgi:hypothetical protein
MAKKIELQIPSDLGLTKKQMSDLTKSFKKQLVETLKANQKASKAKSKLMVVDVLAKPKNQVV